MMRHLVVAALVVACAGLVGSARADDVKGAKASATGTWTWSVSFGDRNFDMTLKLRQDGDKLTGNIKGPQGRETAIQDGMVKNGEVCFKVNRKGRQGQEFTSTYKGKLSGDSIKGTTEFKRGDQEQKRDWEAKRVKD